MQANSKARPSQDLQAALLALGLDGLELRTQEGEVKAQPRITQQVADQAGVRWFVEGLMGMNEACGLQIIKMLGEPTAFMNLGRRSQVLPVKSIRSRRQARTRRSYSGFRPKWLVNSRSYSSTKYPFG